MLAEDTSAVRFEHRLRLLARRMLDQFPRVRRWDETDDILQEAAIRLVRALNHVALESELHLYRLAALQIRRVLLDLCRRYSSPHSFAAKHETGYHTLNSLVLRHPFGAAEPQPSSLEPWTCFHRAAGALPAEEREVFDLIWYDGLSQEEVAVLIGVTKRTVQRRWRKARLELVRRLDGEIPE